MSMPEDKPKPRRFRAANTVRPEPQLVARQMEVTALAFRVFGDAEPARRFLNEAHEALGGRPIDIAGVSPEGLRRVVDALQGPSAAASPLGQ